MDNRRRQRVHAVIPFGRERRRKQHASPDFSWLQPLGRVAAAAALPISRWWYNSKYDGLVVQEAVAASEAGRDALKQLFAEMAADHGLTEAEVERLGGPRGPRVGPKMHQAVAYIWANWGTLPYTEENWTLNGHRIRQYLLAKPGIRMVDVAKYADLLTAASLTPTTGHLMARGAMMNPETAIGRNALTADMSKVGFWHVARGQVDAGEAAKIGRYARPAK